jgi:hypothetical protein
MGSPRQQQPKHIAQIVPGVGNQRDRVSDHAEYDLRDHKSNVERRTDCKSPTKIRRRVIVSAMAMIFAVVVVIVVVVIEMSV